MGQYRIVTPEQVSFHFQPAGLTTRAMAWVLDQILVTVLRAAFVMLSMRAGMEFGMALASIAVFALDFGYYMVFEFWWAGQSPGKRYFHIRVINARGGRLLFPEIFARNLMRTLDTLPLAMLTGGTVAFLDRYHRRLGDFVGETLVVRDARQNLPTSEVAQRSRVNTFQEDPALRSRILARVTREERDLLLDMMLRADSLDVAAREELFRNAAQHFRERYALPDDLDHLSDEQTVMNLALLVRSMSLAG